LIASVAKCRIQVTGRYRCDGEARAGKRSTALT